MDITATLLSFSLLVGVVAPIPVVPSQPWQVKPGFSQCEDVRPNWQVASALETLGDLAFSQDAPVDAETFYRRAISMFIKLNDTKHLANCTGKLAVVLGEQNRIAAAREESIKALEYYDQLHPRRDVNMGSVMHNLGWLCQQEGDRRAACRWYSQAVIYYRFFEKDQLANVLSALSTRALARIYAVDHEYSLSAKYYRECMQTLQKYLPDGASLLNEVRREYQDVKTAASAAARKQR